MRMYDVVALGELLIDFVHQGNNDVGYPLMQGNPGGAPGNFLSTLSKFGAKTGFLGKVGSDRFGRMLVKTFRDAGVETKGILVDDRYFTTLAFVTLDDSGDREFSFARKPGADRLLGGASGRLAGHGQGSEMENLRFRNEILRQLIDGEHRIRTGLSGK